MTTGKGGGHKSSSDAIKSALLRLDPAVDVNAYDAMAFMPGYTGDETGYITFTTRYRFFWKCFFELSSRFKGISNHILAKPIYKRFCKLIDTYKPDVILSVHPCFVGSVTLCLKKRGAGIPVYTCIIDLVKHSRLWHDKGCAMTFVPTAAMRQALLAEGFSKDRVLYTGFPVSEKYDEAHKKPRADIDTPHVLMVNPSLKGNRATGELIAAALEHRAEVTVVTGSNKGLKNYLDTKLANAENVTVLGYVRDLDERLARADVLVAKAGPNMILEAVKMCVPVLITGHIPGQEEQNYRYIVENGYGIKCESPKELSGALDRLFANNYELLKTYSCNEQGCTDVSGAEVVARQLLEALSIL
ncbi:MAG: glycosyltransferase [Coriobacteriia bacterium]|nr:glycosyltransferase [Coriobacteriia bacterium]